MKHFSCQIRCITHYQDHDWFDDDHVMCKSGHKCCRKTKDETHQRATDANHEKRKQTSTHSFRIQIFSADLVESFKHPVEYLKSKAKSSLRHKRQSASKFMKPPARSPQLCILKGWDHQLQLDADQIMIYVTLILFVSTIIQSTFHTSGRILSSGTIKDITEGCGVVHWL